MAAIDVLLPVRNGMPFLEEAIDSIRMQTFADWRLLVLDHGSRDGSLELSQRLSEADKRISVFSHPEAAGVADLRNIGLAKCDCRHLLLQDADDVSMPSRMRTILKVFDAAPHLFAVGGEAIEIDSAGRRTGYLRVPTDPRRVTAASFFCYPMLHPTIAANFPALERCGALYGKDILSAVPASETLAVRGLAEDYILFGQLALIGPCANIRAPLIRYRRHEKSVGIANPAAQIQTALEISRFLAKSFCRMKGLEIFDPGPFCNHADYVFDFKQRDYSDQFSRMAASLRRGLGNSPALERELAFRNVLSTRKSSEMALRYLRLRLGSSVLPNERRTVRNWLLRDVRRGKYIYRSSEIPVGSMRPAI